MNEERLPEELKELSERVERIEKRLSSLEKAFDPLSLVELSWRIAVFTASAHKLLNLAKSEKFMFLEFEEDLRDFLHELGKLLEAFKKTVGTVDWELVQESTSIMLSATKKMGIPFTTIANTSMDFLGGDAARIFKKEDVQRLYGEGDFEKWRKMIKQQPGT